MIELAEGVPAGCDGLLFCPHLGGRICPAAPRCAAPGSDSLGDTSQHISFVPLSKASATSTLTTSAFCALWPPGESLIEARVIGGGAQSDAWNQMKADILGVPYRKVLRSESATWGAALVAGKASGVIGDLAQAALGVCRSQRNCGCQTRGGARCMPARSNAICAGRSGFRRDLNTMPSPIRVCLVGAGRAGQVHANSLVEHLPGGELVALVDQNLEVLKATGDRFGVEARFATLEQALANSKFDAVVITTPTFTHKSLTILAASEGKHIFCEKPMALTLVECDEMIEAAEARHASSDRLHAAVRSRVRVGRRTHPGRRDRTADVDQVADARARPASALGTRP